MSHERSGGADEGDELGAAAVEVGLGLLRGGTYLAMEGPQFSSYAESMTYKNLGYAVIGMTNPGYTIEAWTPADSVAWLKAMTSAALKGVSMARGA